MTAEAPEPPGAAGAEPRRSLVRRGTWGARTSFPAELNDQDYHSDQDFRDKLDRYDSYVRNVEVGGSSPLTSTVKAFARLAERAGMPEVRLHDLRHFVATRLLSSGIDVRTVAGRLGHKNANVTLNVYAHFLPEADREAADLLGRLLAPVEGAG